MIRTARIHDLLKWLAVHHVAIAHNEANEGEGKNTSAFSIYGQEAGGDVSELKYPRMEVPDLSRGRLQFTTGMIDSRNVVFQLIDLVDKGNYANGIEAVDAMTEVATDMIRKLKEISRTNSNGWEDVIFFLLFDNIIYQELGPNETIENCYGVQVVLPFVSPLNSDVDSSKWN